MRYSIELFNQRTGVTTLYGSDTIPEDTPETKVKSVAVANLNNLDGFKIQGVDREQLAQHEELKLWKAVNALRKMGVTVEVNIL